MMFRVSCSSEVPPQNGPVSSLSCQTERSPDPSSISKVRPAIPSPPATAGDHQFTLPSPLLLQNGQTLESVRLHYSIYGTLNEKRDNAVLVCHALSGSSRAAEWWPDLFGEDRVFDLRRDCVICVNVPGSCYGSTGPHDLDPQTGIPYGGQFPVMTIRDWVRSQALLLDHLGIERLQAVVGGSIGGMQAIQWAIDYPERVLRCVAIGAAPLSAMGLALNHLQRQAIMQDEKWQKGTYSPEDPPRQGLALAREIAMCSYKSPELFQERNGRRQNRNGENPLDSLADRYDIGGYLDYQGEIFHQRFDANAYLIITRAMDSFDPALGYASERVALQRIQARVLLVGISSDWLFPARDVAELADRLQQAGVEAEYAEIDSHHGHDAFLAEPEKLLPLLREGLLGPARRKSPGAPIGDPSSSPIVV